jgi:hypothetical protein
MGRNAFFNAKLLCKPRPFCMHQLISNQKVGNLIYLAVHTTHNTQPQQNAKRARRQPPAVNNTTTMTTDNLNRTAVSPSANGHPALPTPNPWHIRKRTTFSIK